MVRSVATRHGHNYDVACYGSHLRSFSGDKNGYMEHQSQELLEAAKPVPLYLCKIELHCALKDSPGKGCMYFCEDNFQPKLCIFKYSLDEKIVETCGNVVCEL